MEDTAGFDQVVARLGVEAEDPDALMDAVERAAIDFMPRGFDSTADAFATRAWSIVGEVLGSERWGDLRARMRAVAQAPGPDPEQATQPRFRFLWDHELDLLLPPRYLVGQHLPDEALGMLYGPSGVGKSFLAVDIAQSIQTGRDCVLGPVEAPGQVVYIVAEGTAGMASRLRAWRGFHGVEDYTGLLTVPQRVPLADTIAAGVFLDELVQRLDERQAEPRLVVVDTFNRCLAGRNESKGEDAGAFLEACDEIRHRLAASVLWIHHPRKDGDDHRGHTSLYDDADFVWRLKRTGEVAGDLEVLKQKDGALADPIPLILHPHGSSMVTVRQGSTQHESGLEEGIIAFVHRTPGCSTNAVKNGVAGRGDEIGNAIARMLANGTLRDQGKGNARRLILPPSEPIWRESS